MVLSEYSIYKDFVMENVESEEQERKKLLEEEERKIRGIKVREEKTSREVSWVKEAVDALGKYFEPDSHYKWKVKLANILEVAKDMEKKRELIEQLVNLLKRRSTPEKDIRFIIRVLRRTIEFEIMHGEGGPSSYHTNNPIYLWKALSPEHYNQTRGLQNLMNEKNIVQAIFELLYRHPNNKKITREVLILSITLLYGGNKAVQESFYNFFKVNIYSREKFNLCNR